MLSQKPIIIRLNIYRATSVTVTLRQAQCDIIIVSLSTAADCRRLTYYISVTQSLSVWVVAMPPSKDDNTFSGHTSINSV